MAKLTKTRARTFWSHQYMHESDTGVWIKDENEKSLEQEINEWLDLLDVRPIYISAPTVTPFGKDAKGRIHLMIGVSLLYLAEDVIDEPGPARPPEHKSDAGAVAGLFAELARQLPTGVDLRSVVRVAQSGGGEGAPPAGPGKS